MRALEHAGVHVVRGRRTGVTVCVAVHSLARGQAIGGCRRRGYDSWQDGVSDALRLSAAMTVKTALADLPHGGGKTVVMAGPDEPVEDTDLFHDVGDAVADLDGAYATGPDVGTGPREMALVRDRTPHVFYGRGGDSSPDTATGTLAALRATADHLWGAPDLSGRRVLVVGAGRVGRRVVQQLLAAGARVTVSDTDPRAAAWAADLGIAWVEPAAALHTPTDVLVPAAVGGLLTVGSVGSLACAAVVGPANDQLAEDRVAEDLHRAGVLWVPDQVVGAGGIIGAVGRERRHLDDAGVSRELERIAATTAEVLSRAAREGRTPHATAQDLARDRVESAGTGSGGGR